MSRRATAILATVSLGLVFSQASVFASFGLLILAMQGEFGWSAGDTALAYTIVVAGACVSASLAVVGLRSLDASRTIVMGQLVLAAAFTIIAMPMAGLGGLLPLYLGAFLAGSGFSLSGNTLGVFLISGWTGARAGRLIGIYMMVGISGNAVGPPLVQAAIGGWSWRVTVLAIAICATAMALVSRLVLREPPILAEPERGGASLRLGAVLVSPVFACLAAAIVVSQTCQVTLAAVVPAHLANQSLSAEVSAGLLSMQGISAALTIGLLGFAERIVSARRMLPWLLAAGGGGLILLADSTDPAFLNLGAVLLGLGIGGTTLCVTLLLVRYFGATVGAACLGAVWTMAGLAAAGPWISGLVADATGRYTDALVGLGLVGLPVAAAALALPRTPDETNAAIMTAGAAPTSI